MGKRIEDYSLLGNGQTAALLSREGSIEWLCWPRFDSDACFASLLGTPENGEWSIAPTQAVIRRVRRYQQDTLVMETDLVTADGAVRLIDFMPVIAERNAVIRIVVGLHNTVRLRCALRLRFDYGLLAPWMSVADGMALATRGPDVIALRSDAPLTLQNGSIVSDFDIREGERVGFALSHAASHGLASQPIDAEAALLATQQYWRRWVSAFDNSRTSWPGPVRRSLLTLKALIHASSGAMVAASTTSLPEAPGGSLNWDYRYCWLRDTCFALVALLNAGFHEEARAWRDWLVRTIACSPEHIAIMYRVDGSRRLEESLIGWLGGYRYAQPVRVGNSAAHQQQVDVFGEVIDCLDIARRGGLPSTAEDDFIETRIVEHLEKVWNTPGSGIWESRSTPRHYTYSRVMAWVAMERYITHRAHEPAYAALVARLKPVRDQIHREVCEEAWNEGRGSFTRYYGSDELDGSLLLMPLVGFLPANDARMLSTIEAIRRELTEDGLIRRRRRGSNEPSEGTFLACSCWMADCLHMLGRHNEARAQFDRVLEVANDVGLLAEQYDAQRDELAGNFPQALSHLAVINTALGLSGPTLQRGGG
ncbi:glycoside hydrolase family 15 protein [Caballeronia sp. LZ065]|uniref:glycoside hydrolase family 15 protein n=1 Tax=Caballeronia sp. LZ065 TaxID=3038571 RepID=UPI0028581325|nr:glycoside hydrolase family 15 protein [Caballeronia sp. LZ065]MDR5784609.1 glycoside hydrolase family 15 protein [Caballeronia sp. LZ065]